VFGLVWTGFAGFVLAGAVLVLAMFGAALSSLVH